MKVQNYLPLLTLAFLAGCGGDDGNSPTPLPVREVLVVNGQSDLNITIDGMRFDNVKFNEILGPFPLADDDLSVRFDDADIQPAVDVPIPAGRQTFVLFDSASFSNSGPPDFLPGYPVRAVPDRPASGVTLTAFGPYVPEPINSETPVDLYLVPEGSKPSEGAPFDTTVKLQRETSYTHDFPAASGKWVIWGTRPGKPANTLFKTVSFERKNGTSVLLQTSTQTGATYVSR